MLTQYECSPISVHDIETISSILNDHHFETPRLNMTIIKLDWGYNVANTLTELRKNQNLQSLSQVKGTWG